MHKLLRPVGELAARVESWWALGALIVGTGLFQWLGLQWEALASQGWAAVLIVATVSASIVAVAVSLIYLVAVRRRNDPASAPGSAGGTPASNSPPGEPLEAVDRQAVNELVTFIRAQVDQVSGYTIAVLSSITVPLETKGELGQCLSYISQHGVLDQIEQARGMLIIDPETNKPVQPDVHHLQEIISNYHRLHLIARNIMHELGHRLGHDFRSDRQYHRWRTLDEHYLTKLRELASNPSYQHLREQIGNLGYGGGVYVD